MKDNFFVTVNPNSGAGKAGKDWEGLKNKLHQANVPFDYVISQKHRENIGQVTEAIDLGYRKIITVGGDGTLHHVVNGIFSQQAVSPAEISVGMISIGTGNDWVRHFNIPRNYKKAISVIQAGKTATQDVGILQYEGGNKKEYFMNFAGIGYDAYVVEHTAHLKKFGQSAYLYGLVQCLFKYDAQHLTVEVDGEKLLDEEVFMMIAGLGKFAGGGMKLSPDANIDDGLLDLTIGKELSKAEIIMLVHKLFNGSYVHHPKVVTRKCKHIKVMPHTAIVQAEADGELIGGGPFEISIAPQKLKIFIP